MTTEVKPEVLIVGAGIGGLLLGALLERAMIPYTIFERTSSVKPLGKCSIFVVVVLYLSPLPSLRPGDGISSIGCFIKITSQPIATR